MLNKIRSAPPTLAVLLAAVMASRKLIKPSAPLFAFKAEIDAVLPSIKSAAVVTTNSAVNGTELMVTNEVALVPPVPSVKVNRAVRVLVLGAKASVLA